ncbi:MAG: class I SAM-dependent methyltransferase, partial [Solirubrobacteraceae bacterium]
TQGDATRMPFEDQRFSAVVCFTMLHHIPSRNLVDPAGSRSASPPQGGCGRVLTPRRGRSGGTRSRPADMLSV